MKRRLISLLLALALVITCLPQLTMPAKADFGQAATRSVPNTRAAAGSPYESILNAAIQKKGSYGGRGFLYDANGDGIDELFYVYSGENSYGYTSTYGAVYTIRNGQAVPIQNETILCDEAGAYQYEIGVISMNGKKYVYTSGGVYSTDTSYGTNKSTCRLYSVSSGFSLEQTISWQYSFKESYEVGSHTITRNGQTISLAEYNRLMDAMWREKTMGKAVCWINNNEIYDDAGKIFSLEELLSQCRKIEPFKGFYDVSGTAYYAAAVAWAVDHNITKGTSDTTFSPDAGCTRGQVVTFLWRAAGCPEPKSSRNPFVDVSRSAFYYNAVLWAVEQGITKGMSAGKFAPDAVCTRAQVVTFLWRANGAPRTVGDWPFEDVSAGQYFAEAMLWALTNGVTNGTSSTTFSPNATCTRGQIVTFLYRAED